MPVTATPSQHYNLILDDAVRQYHDRREVCCDTRKGKAEYSRRVAEMALRQHNVCGLGPHLLRNATFGHDKGRGMGAAHRDDRILDENGEPMNHAECWECNGRKGSRRS
jgi:hypothetical protein